MPNPLRWTLAGLQGSDLPPPPGSALGSGSPSSLPWSLLAFRLRFCPAAKENGVLAQNPLRVGGGGGGWRWQAKLLTLENGGGRWRSGSQKESRIAALGLKRVR